MKCLGLYCPHKLGHFITHGGLLCISYHKPAYELSGDFINEEFVVSFVHVFDRV